MKKFLLSISVTLSLLACNNTPAEDERQIHRDLLEDFTCPIFRAWVLEIFDSNKDGEIWENELIHYGNIMDISDLGITSLEGI